MSTVTSITSNTTLAVHLNSRVVLEVIALVPVVLVGEPIVPFITNSRRLLQSGTTDVYTTIPFQYLNGQSTARMPSDMTMHKPSSWIISLEGDEKVSPGFE